MPPTAPAPAPPTLRQAIDAYLASTRDARSENTAHTYRFALEMFCQVLLAREIDPEKTPAAGLPEEAVSWFAAHLTVYEPATRGLYLQAAKNLYDFLLAMGYATPNMARVTRLIRTFHRKQGQRLPQFDRDAIEKVLDYATALVEAPVESDAERLINLRDRAFILTLADTGLRVHEACQLLRKDLDWNEQKAIVTGKGDQEAVIRFSRRSLRALKDYLSARAELDGSTGRALTSQPVFARHDKGAGKQIKAITTTTGRNIIHQRVRQALGQAGAAYTITPHSFRHYFVTIVLRSSGNLKLAQALARHKNIAVTQRYAHLSDDDLDKGYEEAFEG